MGKTNPLENPFKALFIKNLQIQPGSGNSVESAVNNGWKMPSVVSKVEKAGELFVAQMQRSHRDSSI